MYIDDPIATALGIFPSVDKSHYPSLKKLQQEHPLTETSAPWNKGLEHVEGQKESLTRRLENGTHNFLNVEWRMQHARRRVENGSYSTISKKTTAKQLADGTHPFLHFDSRKQQKRLLEEGKHHSQKKHVCPHCGTIGRGNTMKRHHFDNCKSLTKSNSSDTFPVDITLT